MKNMKHPLENPASSRRGKCRPGCSDRVRGIMKRGRTYKARADGCGAGAGRVATTGLHGTTTGMQRATTGPHCPTTGLQCATTARNARRRIDSSRRRVRNARRRIQELKKKQATTGTQRSSTGTGSGNDRCCSCDDSGDCATRVADRATTGPTPRERAAATVYKGGELDRDSRSD